MSDFRLKAFYSVAHNLSFTKASQELFVSQPAITKHVRKLESLYGVRLFWNRKGNTISLTHAGEVLLEHCERILSAYRHTTCICSTTNMPVNSIWRARPPLPSTCLPPSLAAFTEKFPKLCRCHSSIPIHGILRKHLGAYHRLGHGRRCIPSAKI